MKHLTALLTLVFLLAGTAHAAPSWEAQGFAHRPVADKSSQSGMSLDQAVKKVQRETGGRILSAETQGKAGQREHRIKVLTPDKRVRVVRIPASN